MKIGALVHMYPPHHNAGAEHMLHAMLEYAVKQGHECVVVIDQGKGRKRVGIDPYVLDGVKVSEDKRTLKGIDILLTHLDRTPDAEKMVTERRIPLVQIMHNDQRPAMAKKCDLAVYNTDWLLEAAPMPFDCDSIVVHPPIWADRYKVDVEPRYITLINLQKPKGVEMFYTLARELPDYEFLGVKGSYGKQEPAPKLKNLTIIENQPDIRKVYEHTAILLMPSSYESYGRCAVEAAVSGIPTIAHRTAGLWEALGECGSFPLPDSESWKAAINYVRDTYPMRRQMALSLARSLDPEGDMKRCLEAFECQVAKYA